MKDNSISHTVFVPLDLIGKQDLFQSQMLERDIVIARDFLEKISSGDKYIIQLKRYKIPSHRFSQPGWDYGMVIEIQEVKSIHMELRPAPKLNLWARINVLFTGNIPLEINRVR